MLIIELSILVFILMSLTFIIASIKKNNSIIDTVWGIGFVIIAWYTLIRTKNYTSLPIIVTLLVTVWGIRLASHIHSRNSGKPEDYRYATLRTEWKKYFLIRSYIEIFLLQGILMLIISTAAIYVISTNKALSTITILGIIIWLKGFLIESIADKQLKNFSKNKENKGKTITQGLWKYSRHPNYFGETLQWWGIYIMTLPTGYYTIISPILITLLIVYVTGIPLLEEKSQKRKGWNEYAQKTSKFIPWFPSK